MRWSQQAYRSMAVVSSGSDDHDTNVDPVPPAFIGQGFSCDNAAAFVKAYRNAFAADGNNATAPSSSSASKDDNSTTTKGNGKNLMRFFLAKTTKDRDKYVQQLSEFLVTIELERTRVASHPVTKRFWSQTTGNRFNPCSVCSAPSKRVVKGDDELVPLELVEHQHCGEENDTTMAKQRQSQLPPPEVQHTTVFSPITFRSLHFYDPVGESVVTRCSCCGSFLEVSGAVCDLCEAFLA